MIGNFELENEEEPSVGKENLADRESLALKRKSKFPVWEVNKQWSEVKNQKIAEALEKREDCSSTLLEINRQIHNLQSKISRRKALAESLDCAEHKEGPRATRHPRVESRSSPTNSDKLEVSPAQFLRRRNATLEALSPIHCSSTTAANNNVPICDDVSQETKMTPNGSIGTNSSDTWHPWDFEKRLSDVKKVERFKAKQAGSSVPRSKVTTFIANNKSRQEFDPPLGRFVDKCVAEPLHVTNNVWQYWFKNVLAIVLSLSKGIKSSSSLSSLPEDEVLVKFLKCLKSNAHCSRLCKNIEQWFNEKHTKGLEFSYRFTGKESKNLSRNFAYLIDELLRASNLTTSITLQLHTLAYVALKVRNAAAVYSRVSITEAELTVLKENCQVVFNAFYVLLGNVTPSIWTLGYAVPYHTAQIYKKLGFGLGLNTMQGREAKHIKLAKYMENTPGNARKHERWWTVFKHEYVRLIWMRVKDPDSSRYRREGR